ncbi:RNA-splicing factor [Coemansia sp. 'formosensis']|nr:RNA-splicing factor [Coemansia sp. 'formosensis']
MGSGDLNMKKSWHPLTKANQNRVAEEKRKAEEEAQRTARIQKELREERQKEEMDMLNASITKKPINKLDWMYSAPSTTSQNTEDLEAYLLGKKNISTIVNSKDDQAKEQDKWKAGGLFAFSNRNANSERDAKAKDLEDPLMDIKRREQAAIQAMLKNTAGRTDAGSEKPKREKRKSESDRDDDTAKKDRKRREHRKEDGSGEHTEKASDSQHRHRHSSKRRREHDREEPHRSRSRRSRSPERRSRH